MGLPHLDTKRGYCRTYRTAHSMYSNTLGIYREEKPGLASVNPLCLFKLPQSRKPTTRRRWQFGSITRSNLGRRRGRKDSPSEADAVVFGPGTGCGGGPGQCTVHLLSSPSPPLTVSSPAAAHCCINAAEPSELQPATESAVARSSLKKHRGGGWWLLVVVVVVGTTTLTSAEEP